MPISDIHLIPAILDEVYRIQPEVVWELGVGFGKYGVLCREVLDAMYGRCRPEQWQRTIFGIEAHEPYRNPTWGAYNSVFVTDFTQAGAAITDADLVLMVDSLEHLEKEQGERFLEALIQKNKNVIVSVPVVPMPQGEMYGNLYEAHWTQFTGPEFDKYNPKVLYRGACLAVSIKGKYV